MAARRILCRPLITEAERLPAGLPPVLQRVYAARAIDAPRIWITLWTSCCRRIDWAVWSRLSACW
jgi:hypothetical protein